MIIIYMLARYGKTASKGEIISVILALVGTDLFDGNDGFSLKASLWPCLCGPLVCRGRRCI